MGPLAALPPLSGTATLGTFRSAVRKVSAGQTPLFEGQNGGDVTKCPNPQSATSVSRSRPEPLSRAGGRRVRARGTTPSPPCQVCTHIVSLCFTATVRGVVLSMSLGVMSTRCA